MPNIFSDLFSKAEEGIDRLTRDEVVQKWLDELGEAEKREKDFLKEAQDAVELFEAGRGSDETGHPFNILYANTETLSPAVYNNTPRPVVKRKVDKQNPLAVAAAHVLQKVLEFQVDSNDRDIATFDELQKTAVQEALVPGRGLCRFDYDADITETPLEDGKDPVPAQVNSETLLGEAVPWNRVRFGYAKQWHKVPWVAFEHFMVRAELIDTFGDKKGAKIKLTHSKSEDRDSNKQPANAEGVKFAHIWEIWDKRTKKVVFISEGFPEVLMEQDDPLGLDGFFNIPRPLTFLHRISSLVPKTLYKMYESQAQELNDVTTRIGKLTRALKVRGFYDGTLTGLDELMRKGDNTLLPAQNVAALQQGQTLDKSIWLMPLQEIIAVLQQLYINRTQIQNVIHQITGIADIMRGASQASETLGAQKMKESWGTMRLKRMQKEVQRFSRESFRLEAEIAAKHFQIETFIEMTGVKLPRKQEKEQAQQMLQMFQQQQAQQQAQMPMPGMPPQPQPQQIPPQIQQAQAMLAIPSWEDVVDFLRNDKLRNYIIDIETNSTVDIEATEDKEELAEFMNAMAQLMNGAFPMVEKGVLPFEAAKALTLSIVEKFRLGDEVEGTFRQLKQPAPKPDPKQAADEARMKAEMQRDEAKFKMEQEASAAEIQNKRQLAELELQVRREEIEMQRQELVMKREFMVAKHAQDMEMLAMKAAMPQQPAPAQGNANANV